MLRRFALKKNYGWIRFVRRSIDSAMYTARVKRTVVLAVKVSARLLSTLAGCWMLLLLLVAYPWSSQHRTIWWACALTALSGSTALMIGALAITARQALARYITLYGACAITCLGVSSVFTQNDASGASLLFVLVFFVLAVTIPFSVAVLCLYELVRPLIRERRLRPDEQPT